MLLNLSPESIQATVTSNQNAYRVGIQANKYMSYVEEDTRNGNRPRLLQNLDLYVGTENRQWAKGVAEKLNEQGRPALTFNVIQQAVDTVLGNLEQRPTDIKFQAISGDESQGIGALQNLYDYDYELGNYEYAKMIMKRDGLIHTGILQMYVDTSVDYRGNIGLRSIHPSHIVIDPFWQTGNAKDIRFIYRAEWLDASQIKAMYQTKSAYIDFLISRNREFIDTQSESLDKVADRSLEWYDTHGQRYKVIECTEMVDETYDCAISLTSGEIDEEKTKHLDSLSGSAKAVYKKVLATEYQIIAMTRRVCKIFTCAPGLDRELVLEDGDYPLQMGRVPYIIFSYKNVYGYRLGMPDILKDAQQSMNKRESQISHILSQSGNNNWLIEADAFKDPNGKADFLARQAMGGQGFELKPGALERKSIQAMERSPIPNDLINATQNSMDMIYRLSSVVPAMQGRQEGSQESGIMNEQKTAQSMIALETVQKSLKLIDQEMADMYYQAAKQLYSGAPREIVDSKNKKVIKLNQRVWNPRTQSVDILNDISAIRRFTIDVAETRIGPGRKATELLKYTQLITVISNPVLKAILENQIVSLLDVSEEVKVLADKSTKAFCESQLATMDSQTSQADAMKAQAEAQIEQANNPQGPAPQPPMAPPA